MFQLLVNSHTSQVDMKLIYPLSLIIFIIFGVFNYAIGKKNSFALPCLIS